MQVYRSVPQKLLCRSHDLSSTCYANGKAKNPNEFCLGKLKWGRSSIEVESIPGKVVLVTVTKGCR